MKPADIIVVCGTDTLSKLIMDAEARETGQPAHVSHTIGVIGVDDDTESVLCMQAVAAGVQTGTLHRMLDGVAAAWSISDKTLTLAQREWIRDVMLTYSCEPYAYPDLVLQLADALTGTDWWTQELGALVMKWTTICSFWTCASYASFAAGGKQLLPPADLLPITWGWGPEPAPGLSNSPERLYLAGLDASRYEMVKLV